MNLLVGSSSPPDKGSGINAYVRELCEALIEQGHRIHFCSPEPVDCSWLNQYGIKHVKASQFDEPLERTKQLIAYVKDQHINGVINNDNALLQNIAPAISCPFISVGHMGRTSVASLACFQHQWTDHVVTISSDMQAVFVSKFDVPVIKCPIVYNGVVDPGEKESYLSENEQLNIVFAGGYSKNKGGTLIEQALSQYKDSWHDIKLDWFGDVPEKIKQKLRDYNFIEFHGRVGHEEFLKTLKNADVLLLPSKAEGCPMTMLEAMSYGVVPLASDGKGAMRWLITSGQHGFICQLDDWEKQMMDCFAYFLGHSEGLSKMKQASYQQFKHNFQRETTAKHITDLLLRPTVKRDKLAEKLQVLRWHRPLRKDGKKAPLIDRFAIRIGWLRKAGVLEI